MNIYALSNSEICAFTDSMSKNTINKTTRAVHRLLASFFSVLDSIMTAESSPNKNNENSDYKKGHNSAYIYVSVIYAFELIVSKYF